MTGTVFNDHIAQAKSAADIAVSFLKGEDVAAVNMVDYTKVTTENLRDHRRRLLEDTKQADTLGMEAAKTAGAYRPENVYGAWEKFLLALAMNR